MEVVSSKININFMKLRPLGLVVSLALISLAVFSWVTAGDAKYGVDFLGGVEIVVEFDDGIDIATLRKTLDEEGFTSAVVQKFEDGSQRYSVRLKAAEKDDVSQSMKEALGKLQEKELVVHKQDFVGPVIGDKIRQDGMTALLLALIGILIYISVRFELRFAIGAITALVHDVVITAGVFIFAGHEVSAAVLAALLTIVGYSLNDTIIVFDRIRENIGKEVKKAGGGAKNTSQFIDYLNIVNQSINQTLSRTILTSLTTLFVVTSLWLFGGGAVVDLAFALVIGVIVGTYSSIFVACPVLLIGIPSKPDEAK
jgi:preprotein translocase subunit SecF